MATQGEEKRRSREARALAIVKAVRRDPNPHAENPFRLPVPQPRHTILPEDGPVTGHVYFAYCAGRIKIGYATDAVDRMCSLGTGAPFPVTLLLTIFGTMEDEKNYHKRFEADRANGEWFNLSFDGDLYDFLYRNLSDDGFDNWMEAQCECREDILTAAANVVNLTGGDHEGRALQVAAWPGTFDVSAL